MGDDIQRLDDRTVQMVLTHLVQEIREDMADIEGQMVSSEDEARQLVAALLQQAGTQAVPLPDEMLPEERADAVAREMLKVLLADPDTAVKARALVDAPPTDSQMSVELAVTSSIVLAALVTWLQTKVHFKIVHKGGQTEFTFEIKKDGASAKLIKTVVETVRKALLLR